MICFPLLLLSRSAKAADKLLKADRTLQTSLNLNPGVSLHPDFAVMQSSTYSITGNQQRPQQPLPSEASLATQRVDKQVWHESLPIMKFSWITNKSELIILWYLISTRYYCIPTMLNAILFCPKRDLGASFIIAQKHVPLIMLLNDKWDIFCS